MTLPRLCLRSLGSTVVRQPSGSTGHHHPGSAVNFHALVLHPFCSTRLFLGSHSLQVTGEPLSPPQFNEPAALLSGLRCRPGPSSSQHRLGLHLLSSASIVRSSVFARTVSKGSTLTPPSVSSAMGFPLLAPSGSCPSLALCPPPEPPPSLHHWTVYDARMHLPGGGVMSGL